MKWMRGIIIVLVIAAWQFVPSSEGTLTTKPIDFSTIRTQSTLEADVIVIGEVVKISNTFTDPNYPSAVYSFVTVKVDTILKGEEKGKENEKSKTITFIADGGPNYSNGTFAEVVGYPTFQKVGELVFLSLKKVTSAKMQQWYKGLGVLRFGKCVIEKDKVTQEYIVKQGWGWVDVNVSDIKKIIPVILKHPEEMKKLERETVALLRAKMPLDGMLAFVRARVAELEALDAQQPQEQK